MTHLDAVRRAQGLPPLPFGAALHLGEILWGNIGAADRLDFTAIGPAVNLVTRLDGLCPRPVGADLGRGRRGDHRAAGAAGRTRIARHRGALHRLHPAGCVSGPSPAVHRRERRCADRSCAFGDTGFYLLVALPTCTDECPLSGVKRTWRGLVCMSANDPKRTQGRRRFLGSAESHLDKFRYAPCFSEVTIA